MTHELNPVPTAWAIPFLVGSTFALAEVTPDPTLKWIEYGVMGLVIVALGWWTVKRENKADQNAQETQERLIAMTEKTTEAITATGSAVTEVRTSINEVRNSIDRQTQSNRALESQAVENGKKIDKLCISIDRTHPRKTEE